MPTVMYCWRCAMDIPMLDEAEWEQLYPFLLDTVARIQAFRQAHNASLKEAIQGTHFEEALAKYRELTGFTETNVNALWHHRAAEFGPPCAACAKPLRTPNARHCAECGTPRAEPATALSL